MKNYNFSFGDMPFLSTLIKKEIPITTIKLKILVYLNQNKKVTISQLSRDLKIDYKNAWRYIREFEKKKIVDLDPKGLSQGKKVFITLKL